MHWLASEQMTFGAWKQRYPDGEVLSTDTGYRKSYNRIAYASYKQSESLMFPVPKYRDELKNKEWVLGILIDGHAKAYPIEALETLGSVPLKDTLGATPLTIAYDKERQWADVKHTETNAPIPSVRSYWFAWQAFYPETKLYKGTKAKLEDLQSPTPPS